MLAFVSHSNVKLASPSFSYQRDSDPGHLKICQPSMNLLLGSALTPILCPARNAFHMMSLLLQKPFARCTHQMTQLLLRSLLIFHLLYVLASMMLATITSGQVQAELMEGSITIPNLGTLNLAL